MSILFEAASPEHQKREKAKAKELRQTQWWRQQIGPGVCHHCQQRFPPGELTMDHLTPIARGGKSTKKNCVPSCKDCNSKKGYKMSVEITLESMSEDLKKLNKDESE
jgi:5-methylcytosine-specific restriction protein A